MAERSKTLTPPNGWNSPYHTIEWSGLELNDTGQQVEMAASNDRSVQVVGTFGSGGTLLIEGSNNGADWATLTDPQGNALSFTSAKIEQVMELTTYLRPRVSAGDGTTNLNCIMLLRRRG